MGVEATFLRKPSICAGKSFYYLLDVAYTPQSHEELMQLLEKDIEPKPLSEALKYAYFFGTFGLKFKHYKPNDFDKGTIYGKTIAPANNLKYKLTKVLYHNKYFPKISQRLSFAKRDQALKNFLP